MPFYDLFNISSTSGVTQDGIEYTTFSRHPRELEVSFKNGTIHFYDTYLEPGVVLTVDQASTGF